MSHNSLLTIATTFYNVISGILLSSYHFQFFWLTSPKNLKSLTSTGIFFFFFFNWDLLIYHLFTFPPYILVLNSFCDLVNSLFSIPRCMHVLSSFFDLLNSHCNCSSASILNPLALSPLVVLAWQNPILFKTNSTFLHLCTCSCVWLEQHNYADFKFLVNTQ